MHPDTVLTVGLVGLIIVCVGGGVGAVMWLNRCFRAIEDRLIEAVHKSRAAGDEQIKEVGEKIDALAARQQSHELHVEQKFLSKDTANMVFGRVEKAIDDMRGDIRDLIKQVAAINRSQ